MDGADRRCMDIGIEPSQPFSDLRRSPSRPVLLETHDQCLDLNGELVGVTVRSARSIRQRLQAAVIVAPKNLVAGLAGDAELSAQPRHLLAVQHAGNELQTL